MLQFILIKYGIKNVVSVKNSPKSAKKLKCSQKIDLFNS